MRFFEVIPLDFSIYLMNNGYKLGDHKILGDEKAKFFFLQNLDISVHFKLQFFLNKIFRSSPQKIMSIFMSYLTGVKYL